MAKTPRSKSPAPAVTEPTSTGPPTPKPLPPLGPRSTWPKYSADEQRLIAEFLGAFRAHAQDAAQKLRELETLAPGSPNLPQQIGYWLHVIGGIDWMTTMLPHRQQHLALLKAIRQQEGTAA